LGFYITPPSALSAVKALICWAAGGCGPVWLLQWRAALAMVSGVLEKVKSPGGPWPLEGGPAGVVLLG